MLRYLIEPQTIEILILNSRNVSKTAGSTLQQLQSNCLKRATRAALVLRELTQSKW